MSRVRAATNTGRSYASILAILRAMMTWNTASTPAASAVILRASPPTKTNVLGTCTSRASCADATATVATRSVADAIASDAAATARDEDTVTQTAPVLAYIRRATSVTTVTRTRAVATFCATVKGPKATAATNENRELLARRNGNRRNNKTACAAIRRPSRCTPAGRAQCFDAQRRYVCRNVERLARAGVREHLPIFGTNKM